MNYYTINYSTDIEEIGHYPQTSRRLGYNPNLPKSHRDVYWNTFPNFIPKFEVELESKAYITNFLHKNHFLLVF